MTANPAVSDAVRRHVEAELHGYYETKHAITRRRDDIAANGHPNPEPRDDGVRTPPSWSDPTLHRATVLSEDTQLREMRRIVEAIEGAKAAFEAQAPEIARFLVLWYFDRRTSVDDCVAMLYVDRSTLWRWKRRIISDVAERLGWA